MALVKIDDRPVKAQKNWVNRDKKAVRHKLPEIKDRPLIDYEKLEWLCGIPGLKDRNVPESSEDAHAFFMQHYKSMFVKPAKKKGLPIHSLNRSLNKTSSTSLSSKYVGDITSTEHGAAVTRSNPTNNISHDIRDHLSHLHHQRRHKDPVSMKADRIKQLRKLLRKLPFERTASDNDQIYKIVKHFPSLADQVPDHVLKELCVVAHLDAWKDSDITVFGNTGMHLILKGSVQPHTDPYFKGIGEIITFRSPTPEPMEELDKLTVGECFGTLEKVEGRDPNSRILTAQVLEPNTEFLKISTSDYKRVVEQIEQKDKSEKMSILQMCQGYKLWSKQPLSKVAGVMSWASYPAHTVLVAEGMKAPFLAYIKSGECHVLRQVEVIHTLQNGKQEKRNKQVVMGKLGVHDSFGEVSIIADEAMTCSVITATPVELGIIEPQALQELDETTVQLLLHSSKRTFGELTEEIIHEEYVNQELKREWNEFKHGVVLNVINSRGIRPGCGKWVK